MILIGKLFLNIVFDNGFVVNSLRIREHIYRIIKTGGLANFLRRMSFNIKKSSGQL